MFVCHVTFTSPYHPRLDLGSTQPSVQWVPGILSKEVKRPGREDDHLRPTSVEVKPRLHGIVLRYLSTGATFFTVTGLISAYRQFTPGEIFQWSK
jgi:hypothetical protein